MIACGLLIVIPTYIAPKAVVGGAKVTNLPFTTLVVVFIGLTTMTISAMFLFMTFRIDRGTKATAREVAGKVARKVAEDKVTDDAVDEICKIRKAGKEAKEEVKKAGGDAVNRVEEIRDHEVIPRVRAAGDDAVEKVREVRDNEAIPKARAAGKKVESETDQMIEEARRKIGEADIEKLVNARLDALLEQADGWPRRLFLRFLRPREPRS